MIATRTARRADRSTLLLSLLVASLAIRLPAQSVTVERVSVSNAGTQGNGVSSYPDITPDGRYVVFESRADNLVPQDKFAKKDIFLRDRVAGTIEKVSVRTNGAQGNDDSWSASMSDDGRYVAFASWATNLVLDDTNQMPDVFLRDRQLGTTTRISVTSAGAQANDWSMSPFVSGNGEAVFFTSRFQLAEPFGVGSYTFQIYSYAIQTGLVQLESKHANLDGWAGDCYQPFVTPDLRYLVFTSGDNEWVPNDTNLADDAFVKDRLTGVCERVSVDSAEQQGTPPFFSTHSGTSWARSVSPDGRFVAFQAADGFDAGDTNYEDDVYLRDRLLGTTEWISTGSPGGLTDQWPNWWGRITADSSVVIFTSSSKSLVPGKTSFAFELVGRFRQHAATPLLLKGMDGSPVDGGIVEGLDITPDGRTVVCASDATNLVPGDTNGKQDIFVVSLGSWTDIGFGLAGAAGSPRLAGAGTLQGGLPGSIDLTQAAPAAPCALFVGLDPGAAPFKGGTLVAVPPDLVLLGLTSAAGELHLPFVWPAGIPAGVHFDIQFAVVDTGGPFGFALSNAVDALTP